MATKMTFPFTIVANTGEKLTFLRTYFKDGLEYLEVENEIQPNAGPPMHVHYKQDEALTVIKGKIGYQEPGGEKKYAGVGETVLFKAGTPHRFWNAGNDILLCEGYATPPENLAYFLTEIYKSSNRNGGKPGLYDTAFLLNRYKSEFGMLEIPPFVQKVMFPIVLFFGKLTGKNRRFAEAP